MFQSNGFQSNGFQAQSSAPLIITGGHFLPTKYTKKRTLSNLQVIFKEAQSLPRVETKEIRDIISEFVAPEIARSIEIPDIIEVDYAAIEANEKIYEKFEEALIAIEKRLEIMKKHKVELLAKQQAEDDELLLMSVISCLIH